jgi:uncharacterized protein (TIRG00374 family)
VAPVEEERSRSQSRLRVEHTQAGRLPRDDEQLRMQVTRRRALAFALFIAVSLAFLYFVLPQLSGVKHTWDRLDSGDPWWLGVAGLMQAASMASYIAIFQGVHVPPGSPIRYRQTYQITMASLAATRLFAAGGAGGVALTAWALRRSGMERREVAMRMIAFLVLLYGVYMAAMIACGIGLAVHLFSGPAPFAVTIVPAILGGVAIILFLGVAFLPADLERRIGRLAPRRRIGVVARRLAAGPASLGGGVRFAFEKVRNPDWAMLGTLGWWAFNIAVLYATFHAFGTPPPIAVLVQGYFVGLLGNLLPLPGGIGGVDGGMIGAFAAFGVSGSLALVAVLTYRLFAFWLPTIPGAIAYLQLRRTVHEWQSGGAALAPLDASRPVSA